MAWERKYIGKPFADGGRTLDAFDCWGLVYVVYLHDAKPTVCLPLHAEISASNLIAVARNIDRDKDGEDWVNVPQSEIQPFDVCVMRFHGTKRNGHVGLVSSEKKLLHVELCKNTVHIPFNHVSVRERISCFRRHKKLIR